jgi:hypothetical protein
MATLPSATASRRGRHRGSAVLERVVREQNTSGRPARLGTPAEHQVSGVAMRRFAWGRGVGPLAQPPKLVRVLGALMPL